MEGWRSRYDPLCHTTTQTLQVGEAGWSGGIVCHVPRRLQVTPCTCNQNSITQCDSTHSCSGAVTMSHVVCTPVMATKALLFCVDHLLPVT
jgi:hypothetical protein